MGADQDRLIRWHRQVSPWALGLIAVHVVLTTVGYTPAVHSGLLAEITVLITSYRDILAAVAGFGLLVLAGITSCKCAGHCPRRRWQPGLAVIQPLSG